MNKKWKKKKKFQIRSLVHCYTIIGIKFCFRLESRFFFDFLLKRKIRKKIFRDAN